MTINRIETSGNNALSTKSLTSPRYRNYVLALLVVVYAFNFLDRQIMTILAEPIKNELDLSDTQVGLMTGLAFALFYTLLGIPIARLADRINRVNIMSIALVAWSGMTAVCGIAQNFTQMLASRVGVGIGEAGCTPTAHSLIADYFPPEKRASAMSIYSLGIPIGIICGVLGAGWIAEYYGWRIAFLVVGIPGILLAFVVKLTLREPIRGMSDPQQALKPDALPLLDTLHLLVKNRTLIHLAIGAGLTSFLVYGLGQWMPAYFIRVHKISLAEAATYFGLVVGVSSAIGTILGGLLADKLAERDPRFYAWLPGIAGLLSFPFYVVAILITEPHIAIIILIVPSMLNALWLGPVFGSTQNLAPIRARALASAILLFIINIIGLGLGPLIIGILSDVTASLKTAILMTTGVYLWASTHFILAARTIRADLAANTFSNK